jgi:Cys-rich protein (TIGR01571 family)
MAACSRTWLPFLLSLAAGCAVGFYMPYSKVASQLIHALPLDEPTMAAAFAVAPIMVPFLTFILSYCLISMAINILACVFACLCGCMRVGDKKLPTSDADLERQYYYMESGSPQGAWSSGLCSCLDDVPLCCTACLLPFVVVGQLYERVMHSAGTCVVIACAVGALSLFSLVVSTGWCEAGIECTGALQDGGIHCVARHTARSPALCGIASNTSWLAFLITTLLLMGARKRIRERYGIAPVCCGEWCDDCCASLFCPSLTAAQMMRHISTVEGHGYAIRSSTGCRPTPATGVVQSVPMGLPVGREDAQRHQGVDDLVAT